MVPNLYDPYSWYSYRIKALNVQQGAIKTYFFFKRITVEKIP